MDQLTQTHTHPRWCAVFGKFYQTHKNHTLSDKAIAWEGYFQEFFYAQGKTQWFEKALEEIFKSNLAHGWLRDDKPNVEQFSQSPFVQQIRGLLGALELLPWEHQYHHIHHWLESHHCKNISGMNHYYFLNAKGIVLFGAFVQEFIHPRLENISCNTEGLIYFIQPHKSSNAPDPQKAYRDLLNRTEHFWASWKKEKTLLPLVEQAQTLYETYALRETLLSQKNQALNTASKNNVNTLRI